MPIQNVCYLGKSKYRMQCYDMRCIAGHAAVWAECCISHYFSATMVLLALEITNIVTMCTRFCIRFDLQFSHMRHLGVVQKAQGLGGWPRQL